MQDKPEPREVTAAVATDLRIYAGRRWPTMNHKWRKARLASLLGMNERRVKSIYEAEETARLRVDEEARIKALIGQKEEADADADAYRTLEARFMAMEAAFADLRAEIAAATLVREGGQTGRSRRDDTGAGQGLSRRRSADRND